MFDSHRVEMVRDDHRERDLPRWPRDMFSSARPVASERSYDVLRGLWSADCCCCGALTLLLRSSSSWLVMVSED